MTDHFAVLGIPRAPWLDPEGLKERFLRLGAQHHPDAPTGSGPAFTELNAAWQALRDPAQCLRHYLELEHPGSLAGSEQTPHDLADLFMEIAAFRQEARRFTGRLSAAGALARALLEPERIALRARLDDLTGTVAARADQIATELRGGGADPGRLATLLASLVVLGKWSAHLAESRLAV